ncbi:MAG: alpha/beta hydrolase [Rhodobacterales bacterium]|nr:MAG: alpha/beta hydrolase [Rhodobacterales bacterium]
MLQSHHIHLNGQPFHMLTWGDPANSPLVFLHGFPEYSGAWDEVATRLADRFYCVAPDQRGYGQSWAPAEVEHYTTSRLVADVAALVDYLDMGPVTVVGHDWGSAPAYGLAMALPDMVARLIILNGVHPVPFQRALAAGGAQTLASQYILTLRQEGSEQALAAHDHAPLMNLFSAHMDMRWMTAARRDAYRTEWMRPGRLRAMLNWYRASPLRVARPGEPLTDLPPLPVDRLMVRCPHLLLWGENDTALLPEASEGLETFAPDLTRLSLPGTDHWLHHQNPDAVATAIADFTTP